MEMIGVGSTIIKSAIKSIGKIESPTLTVKNSKIKTTTNANKNKRKVTQT